MVKRKTTHAQEIKAMALACGKDIFPDVKLPKKRKTPTRRTTKNEMREKKIERTIINSLVLQGYIASKSGEQATYNSDLIMPGIADIFVLTERGVVFLEVKDENGTQRPSQAKFEGFCKARGIEYHIIRSIGEALEVLCPRKD